MYKNQDGPSLESKANVEEYWCYSCNVVSVKKNPTVYHQKCNTCGGEALEHISSDNDPRLFQPPTRTNHRKFKRVFYAPAADTGHSVDFFNYIPDARTNPLNGRFFQL